MPKALTAFFVMLFMPLLASAQGLAPLKYQPGVHYEVLPQQVRTVDEGKIEVKELFWYGCHHCFDFEPMVHAWSQQLGDDVVFEPQPVIWNEKMMAHARLFYVAKSLGVLDKIHQPVFNAMNVERKPLQNVDKIYDIFAAVGVERKDFDKKWDSFTINAALKRASGQQRLYRVQGTPEMVVNGKYRVSSSFDGVKTQQDMLQVVDFLIQQERLAMNK